MKKLIMNCIVSSVLLVAVSLTRFGLTAPPEFQHVDSLPDYLKSLQCRESNPDLNECIRNGLQYGIDHLKTGIRDVSLPPLDPTEVTKVTYEFANDIIRGKVTLRHVEISGFGDTQLKKVDYKAYGGPDISMDLEGIVPQLKIKGNHRADVYLNNAKISSKGSFELTLKNLAFKVKFHTKLYERDGHKYMRTHKIDFDPTVGDIILKADGLLPEPSLNNAIVEFINGNWRQFYKLLVTEARSNWEPSLIKTSNNYYSYIPFDLLIAKD